MSLAGLGFLKSNPHRDFFDRSREEFAPLRSRAESERMGGFNIVLSSSAVIPGAPAGSPASDARENCA